MLLLHVHTRDFLYDLSFSLLFLISTFVAVCWADCAPYPISVPIRDVHLSNGQIMRGVAMSVGTPAQNFAFLPQWYGLRPVTAVCFSYTS